VTIKPKLSVPDDDARHSGPDGDFDVTARMVKIGHARTRLTSCAFGGYRQCGACDCRLMGIVSAVRVHSAFEFMLAKLIPQLKRLRHQQ